MLVFDMLLQRYQGYTVEDLQEQDAAVTLAMLDICNSVNSNKPKGR